MNEKIQNMINIMKDSAIFEKIKKATDNFTKQQKLTAGGVVGVLALATVLSVTPMVDLGTSTYMEKAPSTQTQSAHLEKGATDEQWLISIGGNLVLAVNTEEEAAAVFEGVKSYYLTNKEDAAANVAFDREFRWESYSYKEAGGEPAWVMNVGDAIDYIIKGTATPKTYEIQGGDTVWDIAVKNGIGINDLEAMNPGICEARLQIGSEINLYETKPFVNVITMETIVADEAIPYETTYEETDSLFRGQTKVKTTGANGSKQVTAQVTKQNGVIVASNVLEEQILAEPQAQISLKGTAAIPAYTASIASTGNGVLAAPMGHIEVSSGYGASRGSRRHAGIDLRNPKGTAFASVADGVVISAGYSGSYGNIIKVDHGGGLQTYYAHCDTMCVSVGQTVTKGQVMGTVGSTGNATGNVLHFEVRINGVAQNPMNYI